MAAAGDKHAAASTTPMRIPLLLAAAAAALALLLVLLARGGGGGGRDALVTQPRAEPGAEPSAAAPEGVEPAGPARAVEEMAPRAAGPAAAPPRAYPVRGVAVDADGAPVSGVGLAAATDGAGAEPRARTGADGTFALELPRTLAELVSTDPAWLVLSGGAFDAQRPEPLRLVLGPRRTLSGWVVLARDDRPVSGATVRLVPPAHVVWSAGERGEARTGAEGEFALEGVPALPGMRLSAAVAGCLEATVEPAPGATSVGVLRLEQAEPPRARGRVLLADGRPAVGAMLRLGGTGTTVDGDGSFELSVPRPEPGAELEARLSPHAPAVLPGAGARLLAGESLEGLELVFPLESAAIEGRVVDPEGNPIKGYVVEARAPGAQDPAGYAGRTRKDGAFRIEGLAPGTYALAARGRALSEVAFLTEVEAPGAGVELALAAGARRISGVVLRADGAPAAEREVELRPPAAALGPLARVRSDAAGRFAFEAAPAQAMLLRVLPLPDEGALPLCVEVAAGGDRDVPLRLPAARPVRFEAADGAAPPDGLYAVDAAGGPVALWDSKGRSRWRVDLAAGRSEPFHAPEAVALLVLCRGGRELARVALAPDASGLVRW